MAKKKNEITVVLKENFDPQLMRTFSDLTRSVTDLDKNLDQLLRSKGLDKITADAKEAQDAFEDLSEDTQKFGEVFDKTLKFTDKIFSTAGVNFKNMISDVSTLDDTVHHMGAAVGASAEEMAQFKDITENIYKANLGKDFTDIGNALIHVQRVTGLAGHELENTTKNALILRDTFGYDVNESVRSADTLMRQFGLTGAQAYNLIAQGSQKGLNEAGELLASINKFAPQFSVLGFSASEMFDFFSAGLDAGIWDLDKMGDMVKEFQKTLNNPGDAEAQDALAQILSPEDAQKIFDGISDGSTSGADALKTILSKLAGIEDPIKQQSLAVKILGDEYESLGQKVFQSLATVESQFDMTTNTMKQIEEIKYSGLSQEFQALGREITSEVILPLGEKLLPVLQDMTEWASDNTGLVTTLALAAPAGMLTKNAISIGKDLSMVGRSLFGTTRLAGMAAGLLTNPVGLAIGAVGALTVGVIAYEKHQEAARQALLNMGDEIDKAYNDYTAVDEQTQRTRDLITEYDLLKTKINDAKTPAEELAEAREKLKSVEQQLIDLNPDILRAEDAKSDKFREQLELADKINTARSEMSKRDLEIAVIEGEEALPELEAEYDKLISKSDELNEAYQKAIQDRARFSDYLNQEHAILNNPNLSNDEINTQLDALSEKIKNETGYDYHYDKNNPLSNYVNQIVDAAKDADEELDKIEAEKQDAEESFQSLYDNKVMLIEDELGASIDEMVSKYNSLSDAEKDLTVSALKSIQELNTEVDKIPAEKRINVTTMFQSIVLQPPSIPGLSEGGPVTSPEIGPMVAPEISKTPVFYNAYDWINNPTISRYEIGGRVTSPELAWVGEGGNPEWIIPENNSKRSHELYAAAGMALGYNPGGNFAPVYSPQIIIKGQANEQVIQATLRDSQREWEQNMLAWQRQQQRRSLVGS
ncbi:Chromosome partition protein Smc [compost metagenome]